MQLNDRSGTGPAARVRGVLAWAAWLVALCTLPFAAQAECTIATVPPTFQTGEPNEALAFSFQIQDDGGGMPCVSATGTIQITFDNSGGAMLDTNAFSGPVDSTQNFTLTLGPTRGGFVQVEVNCPIGVCANGVTLFYGADVRDIITLQNSDPADGTTQATPNAVVPYEVQLFVNGSPGGYEGSICFEIVSNPAGDAQLIGGAPSPQGIVCPPGAVSVNPDFSSGLAQVSVDVGSGAAQPVQVTAYPVDDPSVMVVASFATTLGFQAVGGTTINTAPGQPFQVEVRTTDIDNQPVSGQQVTFTSGNAAITPASTSTTTGANGSAVANFTASQSGTFSPGVTATYDPTPGSPGSGDETSVAFTVVVESGEVLEVVSGQGQIGSTDSTSQPLVVRYTVNEQPVAGATVNWSVLTGDATPSATSTVTDASGETSITVDFGATPGQTRVQATAGGADPAIFILTARDPAFGGSIVLESGQGQRGPVFSPGDAPIVVRIEDADGLPAEGVLVDWQVVSGPAVLDGPSSITGADGRAAIGFNFGPDPGTSVIRASLRSGAFVDAAVETVVPLIAAAGGDGQTGPVGTTLPQPLQVQIALPPAAAKGLSGVPIQWQVVSGGGQLANATTQTDEQGRATNSFTLGPNPGPNVVRATVPDGGSVEFTATGVAADGSSLLRIVSGNNQTLPTNQASAPLVIELVDASGQPVAGAQLQWSADNAQLQSASTTTGSDGRSSNTATVVLPGAASVTVAVAGTPELAATFSLTGGVRNTQGLQEQQVDIGGAVDALCPELAGMDSLTPEQADLLARCLELVEGSGDNPGDVAEALQELVQDVALTQVNAALVTAGAQFDNLNARIAALRSGASGGRGLALQTSDGLLPMSLLPQDEGGGDGGEVGTDFSRWGFFASGTIGRGEVQAGSSRPEYDFDTSGLTAGVDYRINDRLIAGAAIGYAQHDTDVAGDAGKVDTTGWSISAYGTWYRDDSWYVDGVLTYGSNSYDIERRIVYDIVTSGGTTRVDQTATADSDGSQLSLALSVGRDFQRGAWNLGPYARATWTRVDFDAYEEQLIAGQPGAGLGLAVDPRSIDSFTGVIGGKLTYTMSRDWGILMPHLNLEWEHEFQDDPEQVVSRFLHDPTRTAFLIEGEEVDSDYFNVGIGLSALWPGGKSAFLYYEHLVGNSDIDQGNLAIGIRIEF